ncbi:hypothetical protein FA95DRAFT_683154 [Auriscalpium vulgare]|uniref:Uncharacterized protein n=1 Tax=Auriscalpium vulgare TaxID=40419 RepID=A0ACB8S128_9AGAM|nr:hypothetical protein FA95DRAFT_683154 [Auriscalpium vulgare]
MPSDLHFELFRLSTDRLSTRPDAALRIWQEILSSDRSPFLLVRIGDGWARFGYSFWALGFYEQAQSLMGVGTDLVFDDFLGRFRSKAAADESSQRSSVSPP